MRVELDVPISESSVQAARAAMEERSLIEFKNKHGKIEKCRVLNVKYEFMPQGIGNGYFMDLMFEGDDTTVSEYLAQQLADKQAGQ